MQCFHFTSSSRSYNHPKLRSRIEQYFTCIIFEGADPCSLRHEFLSIRRDTSKTMNNVFEIGNAFVYVDHYIVVGCLIPFYFNRDHVCFVEEMSNTEKFSVIEWLKDLTVDCTKMTSFTSEDELISVNSECLTEGFMTDNEWKNMTKSLSCSSNHEVHHTPNRKRKFELNITRTNELLKTLSGMISNTKYEKGILSFKKPQSYRRCSVVRRSSTHVEAVIFIKIL